VDRPEYWLAEPVGSLLLDEHKHMHGWLVTFPDFRGVVVLVVAVIAVLFDVRTRRIPNWLTFGATAVAFAYAAFDAGLSGVGTSAAGWLIGAAMFFPFFALGGMGAGDVKLLAALAAWLGPAESVWLAMFATIAGGVVGLIVAVARGYLRTAVSNLWLMLMHWRTQGLGPVPGLTLKDATSPRLAYAIPITIGVLCTLWRR
jgi:prepilin peptidase CpaA